MAWVLMFVAVGQAPQDLPVEKDVVYGHSGGEDLRLDLVKAPASPTPVPAVICVHGGAWQMGSKDYYDPIIQQIAGHGYVAATVEYRLAPKYKWPAQIEDVKCAVRYLRAHAKELNINPEKIAAIGDSAGGNLVLLLGLMDPKDGLEGDGGNPKESSRVQAVINFFGPTDLRTWAAEPQAAAAAEKALKTTPQAILEAFLGTSDRAAKVTAQASPITYVSAGDPPILTFHGTADPVVPFDQAKSLEVALEKAGLKHTLVPMEGEGHGWTGILLVDSMLKSFDFLDTVFKPAAAPTAKPAQ